MNQLFKYIYSALEKEKNVVLCSIVEATGSSPRGEGARMAVFADGTTAGTVGGGAVELQSIQFAKEIFQTGQSQEKVFRLSPNDVEDIGMICGGEVTIEFRYLSYENTKDMQWVRDFGDEMEHQKRRVWLFGGGHVGRALVPVLHSIDFSVIVYDNRKELAVKEQFPLATEVWYGSYDTLDDRIQIEAKDYVVIMTPGHQGDYEILQQVLHTPATYIGCIGSRRKVAVTTKRLQEAGHSLENISRIHSPIGLSIHAETPAEIAISIAAEMIAHRAGEE